MIQGQSSPRELLAFEGAGAIDVAAPNGPVRVLIGTARRHAHALVLGSSSVHTSEAALRAGQQRILDIGEQLRQAGRLP